MYLTPFLIFLTFLTWTLLKISIVMSSERKEIEKIEILKDHKVKGAFILLNLFSKVECEHYIKETESIGSNLSLDMTQNTEAIKESSSQTLD
jgi:hypothetical protein